MMQVFVLEGSPRLECTPDEDDYFGLPTATEVRAPAESVALSVEDLEIAPDPHEPERWTVLAPGQLRLGSRHHWIPEGATLYRTEVAAPDDVVATWAPMLDVRVARVHGRVAALPEHRASVDITGLVRRTATDRGALEIVDGDEIVQRITLETGAHLWVEPDQAVAPGDRLALIDVAGLLRPAAAGREPLEVRVERAVRVARTTPERGIVQLVKLVGDDLGRAWPRIPRDLQETLLEVGRRPRGIRTVYRVVEPLELRLQDRAVDNAWLRFVRGLRALETHPPGSNPRIRR